MGVLLLLLGLVSLPIGFGLGFLRPEIVGSLQTIVSVLGISLVFPAVTEEVLFRVMLLPHPREGASARNQWLWGMMGLALFVGSHPLKRLFAPGASDSPLANPLFLLLAALLGAACTIAYLRSGSLWAAVAIHWAAVVVWLLMLGGYERLHPTRFAG